MKTLQALIQSMKNEKSLQSSALEKAFNEIDRKYF